MRETKKHSQAEMQDCRVLLWSYIVFQCCLCLYVYESLFSFIYIIKNVIAQGCQVTKYFWSEPESWDFLFKTSLLCTHLTTVLLFLLSWPESCCALLRWLGSACSCRNRNRLFTLQSFHKESYFKFTDLRFAAKKNICDYGEPVCPEDDGMAG